MSEYFSGISPIIFEGPDSETELAYRYYDKDKTVMGKSLEEHLRFAVCYWHSFCWGGIDCCARAFLAAARIIEDGKLEEIVSERYRSWSNELGQKILGGDLDLAQLRDHVQDNRISPVPKSGRQEALENLVNRYV